MEVQIPFQQLLKAIRTLSASQKALLRKALDEENVRSDKQAYIAMLLNGPVYTENEMHIIEENRASIARWRAKA